MLSEKSLLPIWDSWVGWKKTSYLFPYWVKKASYSFEMQIVWKNKLASNLFEMQVEWKKKVSNLFEMQVGWKKTLTYLKYRLKKKSL